MKLNLGCCDLPLPKEDGWLNVDNSTSPHIKADIEANVLRLDEHFNPETIDEIYAGHLVEHLYPQEAEAAIRQWYALLKPGGIIGITTPDFRYIAGAYLTGVPGFSVKELIHTYLFSYKQESHHRTIWDVESLTALLANAGFVAITECNREEDLRIPFGAPWQVIVQGKKP